MGEELLHEVKDGVARVTLNRPDQRNALNAERAVEVPQLAEREAEIVVRRGERLVGVDGAAKRGTRVGVPPYQAAMPPIRPPPPTATSTASACDT